MVLLDPFWACMFANVDSVMFRWNPSSRNDELVIKVTS